LLFWICRMGAGSCGDTRAELAPTRYRDGSQNMRVLPSQGCWPKPQAAALSEWCNLVRFDRTDIAGRVRLRDKPCQAGIFADTLNSGRRPVLPGKQKAKHLVGTRRENRDVIKFLNNSFDVMFDHDRKTRNQALMDTSTARFAAPFL